MTEQIIDYVARYYSDKVETHGATPQGVDWNGQESQEMRFEQLLKVCPSADEAFSLLDYGCGYGALFDYLRPRRSSFSYIGFDCSESMIDAARRSHGGSPNCRFAAGTEFQEAVDYTVASGIFNVRGQYNDAQWLDYCLTTIRHMSEISRNGLAFNMLTKYSDADKMRDYLYYADPGMVFDFCKRELSKQVALLHDYPLYEFTILVRK